MELGVGGRTQAHEEAALFRDQTQETSKLLLRLPRGFEGMGHLQAANELDKLLEYVRGLPLSVFASLKLKH